MSVSSRKDAYQILNALPRIGWLSLQKLLDFFENDPLAIFKAKEEDLLAAGLTKTACLNLLQHEQLFNIAKENDALERMGARFISFEDEGYPALLRTIYDPPIGLYVLGNLLQTINSIAIIGSRYADIYGLQMAEKFSSELAERGWSIVSGFARGIDTAAHRGALRVQGATVAVLGCGIDRIYPPENADLYTQIKENGCIISEFPLHVRADRVTFPRRNRILSGMSQATLVVESDLKGGSMLTATFALDQNRQVFAIPGRIDSDMSRGCHQLIRNGATLVTSTEDILEDLDSAPPLELKLDLEPKIRKLQRDTRSNLEGPEAQVYDILKQRGPQSSSDLCALCKQEPQTMQTILFSLELNRWIVRRNDGLFEV